MTTTRSNSSSNVICTLFYKRVLYRCRIFKLPWAHLNHFILSTITKQSTNYSVPSPASIRSTSRSTIQRDSRFLVFSSATGWWGNSRLDRRVRTYAVRFKFLLHRHHPTRLLPLQSPHPDRFPRWRQRCGALLIQPWRRLLLIWGRRNRWWFARSGRGFGASVGDGSAECGWWRTARSPSGWKRRRRTTPPAARKTLASAPQTACLASSASRTARGLGTHGLAWSSRGHNNRARHDCFQNEGINISLARTHARTHAQMQRQIFPSFSRNKDGNMKQQQSNVCSSGDYPIDRSSRMGCYRRCLRWGNSPRMCSGMKSCRVRIPTMGGLCKQSQKD